LHAHPSQARLYNAQAKAETTMKNFMLKHVSIIHSRVLEESGRNTRPKGSFTNNDTCGSHDYMLYTCTAGCDNASKIGFCSHNTVAVGLAFSATSIQE